LLYLYQHPDLSATTQEFAERLYLSDVLLLQEITDDLQEAGLVSCSKGYCTLHFDPDARSCLQCVFKAFEDPLTRQELLDQVTHNPRRRQ
jgi:DNA-binding IscR family transcriptional regulator